MTTHTLKSDGAPYDAEGNPLFAIPAKGKPSTAGTGAAACSCGWLSDVLSSRAARIAAQRIHKMSPGDHAEQPTEPDSPAEVENPQEETMSEKTETPKIKAGNSVAYTQGAKAFAGPMIKSGVALVESIGLDATADVNGGAVVVHANKAETKKAEKLLDAMWTAAYAAFKAWKKENKEQRKTWYQTAEGRSEMLKAEVKFLEGFCSDHITGLSSVL